MTSGQVIAVLLPDGHWYEPDADTYVETRPSVVNTVGTFAFRHQGDRIRGPLSSVLATRETS